MINENNPNLNNEEEIINNENHRFLQEEEDPKEDKGLQIFNIVLKLVMIVFIPLFSFFYLRANHYQMDLQEFKFKFISLYTNLEP